MDGSSFLAAPAPPEVAPPETLPENPGLDAYFRINRENYAALIDGLVADLQKKNPGDKHVAEKLSAARRKYFESALARGTEISILLPHIGAWPPEAFENAIETMPDKVAADSRRIFAEAGARRNQQALWDNLFPAGKSEVVLRLFEDATSVDDKIGGFVTEYNLLAEQNLATARDRDAEARAQNPDARQAAGRTIEQRQIRRDPADPSKLQMLDPNAGTEKWVPGPKLGKFLQDQHQWDLYDFFQLGNESRPGIEKPAQRQAELLALANRQPVSADEFFDSGSLRVVISRDAQKIGEMSSGTRWWSCMQEGAINFHYVPFDIEAGSLVAYVVSADDPEARYPLMRQLIKPFRNEKNEVVLVPASRVYGGEGNDNSRTRDALKQTLFDFVEKQNADKSGEFKMDDRLYADAQATTVMLRADWSKDRVREALAGYRKGALEEWIVELRTYENLLANGGKGHLGQDPVREIKSLKNRIHNVHATDSRVGLARMFYREARKSSIGSKPDPRVILETLGENPAFAAREAAFTALSNNDLAGWNRHRQGLTPEEAVETATIVAATAEAGTDAERTAASAWSEIAGTFSEGELEGYPEDIARRFAAPGSVLQQKAYDLILDKAAGTPADNRAAKANKVVIAAKDCPRQFARAGDMALAAIAGMKEPNQRVKYFKELMDAWRDSQSPVLDAGGVRVALLGKIFTALEALPTQKERVEVAEKIARSVGDRPADISRAFAIMLDNMAGIDQPAERINSALTVAGGSPDGSINYDRAAGMIWEDFSLLPSDLERVRSARIIRSSLYSRSDFADRADAEMWKNFARLTVKESISAALELNRSDHSHYAEWAGKEIKESFAKLSSPEDRIEIAKKIIDENNRALTDAIQPYKILFENIPLLADPKDRVAAALKVLSYGGYPEKLPAYDIVIQNVALLPEAADRIATLRSLSQYGGDGFVAGKILELLPKLPTLEECFEVAVFVAKKETNNIYSQQSSAFALGVIRKMPEAAERLRAARTMLNTIPEAFRRLRDTANFLVLENLDGLPTAKERFDAAMNMAHAERYGAVKISNLAYAAALSHAGELPTAQERVDAALSIAYTARSYSAGSAETAGMNARSLTILEADGNTSVHSVPLLDDLRTQAIDAVLKDIQLLTPEKRVEAAQYIADYGETPEQRAQGNATLLKTIPDLASPDARYEKTVRFLHSRELTEEQIRLAKNMIAKDMAKISDPALQINAAYLVSRSQNILERWRAKRIIVRNLSKRSAEDIVKTVKDFNWWSSNQGYFESRVYHLTLDRINEATREIRYAGLAHIANNAPGGSSARQRANALMGEFHAHKSVATSRGFSVKLRMAAQSVRRIGMRALDPVYSG